MILKVTGKIAFYFVLSLMMYTLMNSIHAQSADRNNAAMKGMPSQYMGRNLWSLDDEQSILKSPYIWAAKIAENYTSTEQTYGFTASFIFLGIIAITAKVVERNKWKKLVERNNRLLHP